MELGRLLLRLDQTPLFGSFDHVDRANVVRAHIQVVDDAIVERDHWRFDGEDVAVVCSFEVRRSNEPVRYVRPVDSLQIVIDRQRNHRGVRNDQPMRVLITVHRDPFNRTLLIITPEEQTIQRSDSNADRRLTG